MITSLAVVEETYAVMEPSAALESPDFLVRSRQEVLRLLNGVMAEGALLSISFLNENCVAATSLVYIDEPSNVLLLECPAEWRSMMDTGGSDSIILACAYEDSKIQFQSGNAMLVDLEGTMVAGLDIPQFMWRFQRRRDQRHKVAGLKITLNWGFLEADAEVTDLGTGGIGMLNCDAEVRLDVGEVLRDCAIALPGVGPIMVDLTVQHQTSLCSADGRALTRVGCHFTGLTDSARQLIAHYLDALVMV